MFEKSFQEFQTAHNHMNKKEKLNAKRELGPGHKRWSFPGATGQQFVRVKFLTYSYTQKGGGQSQKPQDTRRE